MLQRANIMAGSTPARWLDYCDSPTTAMNADCDCLKRLRSAIWDGMAVNKTAGP